MAEMLPESEVREKVQKYENFVNKKLLPQLKEYDKAREVLERTLAEYQELRSSLTIVSQQKLRRVDAMVDVGH